MLAASPNCGACCDRPLCVCVSHQRPVHHVPVQHRATDRQGCHPEPADTGPAVQAAEGQDAGHLGHKGDPKAEEQVLVSCRCRRPCRTRPCGGCRRTGRAVSDTRHPSPAVCAVHHLCVHTVLNVSLTFVVVVTVLSPCCLSPCACA